MKFERFLFHSISHRRLSSKTPHTTLLLKYLSREEYSFTDPHYKHIRYWCVQCRNQGFELTPCKFILMIGMDTLTDIFCSKQSKKLYFQKTTIMVIIFWDLLIICQIFLSPQVKRSVIISNKHGICELSHDLLNNLRLRILEN